MKLSPYLNIKRLEFIVTHNCTGSCRHCSAAEGNKPGSPAHIDGTAATEAVRETARHFSVGSVMTFGGEPLMYPGITASVHAAAKSSGIPVRQLITNGYFSKNEDFVRATAELLFESGVNDLLLSVDSFHQEHIPLGPVMSFARAFAGLAPDSIRLSPAWLVNRDSRNSYNEKTEELLKEFESFGILPDYGNDIFLAGNASKFLSGYYPPQPEPDFSLPCGSAPYTEPPTAIETLSFTPDGSVWACAFKIGNILTESVCDILCRYDPWENPYSAALIEGGVEKMLKLAQSNGISVDTENCRTACALCRRINSAL